MGVAFGTFRKAGISLSLPIKEMKDKGGGASVLVSRRGRGVASLHVYTFLL